MTRDAFSSKTLDAYGSFDWDQSAYQTRAREVKTPTPAKLFGDYRPNLDNQSLATRDPSTVNAPVSPASTYKYKPPEPIPAEGRRSSMTLKDKLMTSQAASTRANPAAAAAASAELSHAAVKRPGGNFQFVARTQGSSEMPTMRQQIKELLSEYRMAMEVLAEEKAPAASGAASTNPLDSDLNVLQGEVEQDFKSRFALTAAVESAKR
jgi:hypothetical protein